MTHARTKLGFFVASLLALAPASFAGPGDRGETAAARHPEVHAAVPEVPRERPALVTGEVDTARFKVLFTKKSKGSARALAERIESVRDDFQKVLGRDWPGVTEIRVGLGRDEMNALALPGGAPPAWAEALAYPGRNIILLDASSFFKPGGEVTLRHELSHVALGQISRAWPHWFQEGMAMYLTGDRFSIAQYTAMFRAVTQDRLFHFETLAEDWPQHPMDVEIAYAESVAFVAHLVDEFGPDRMGALLDDVKGGAPFELAFARAFKTSLRVEEEAWRRRLPNRYSWLPIATGGSALWGVIAILGVAAWVRRRRLRAIKLAEMAAQEAAEEAAERFTRATQSLPTFVEEPGAPWAEVPPDEAEDDPGERGAADDEPDDGGDQGSPANELDPESDPQTDPDDEIPKRRVLH